MRIKLIPANGGEKIEVTEHRAEFLISRGWREAGKPAPKRQSKPTPKPSEDE